MTNTQEAPGAPRGLLSGKGEAAVTRLCDLLTKAIDLTLVCGGLFVCAFVFTNVLVRYLMALDLAWVNEVGETLFVWLTFLGGARAVRSHAHLMVIEFVERMPAGFSRLLFTILALLTIAILIGLVWFGAGIAITNMDQTMSVTGWPVGVMYWAMPVGSALAAIFVVEQILRGDDFRTVAAAAFSLGEEEI